MEEKKNEKKKPDFNVMVEVMQRDGKKSWKKLGVIYKSENEKYFGTFLLGGLRAVIFENK